MPRFLLSLAAAGVLLAITGAQPAFAAGAPAPTKPVDLSRYAGRWYEVARLHNRIEEACASATADYVRQPDGVITAIETCRRTAATPKTWRASVKVLDPGANTKLRLTFFPFVFRDYWVLDHAEDYSWALLSTSNGRYLWLFARKAEVSSADKATMIARAKALGFDTSRLIMDR